MRADPKARTRAADLGRARAESHTPHRPRSLGESGTPSLFRLELNRRCPRPPHQTTKGNAERTFKPGLHEDESGEHNRTKTWMHPRAGRDSFLQQSGEVVISVGGNTYFSASGDVLVGSAV